MVKAFLSPFRNTSRFFLLLFIFPAITTAPPTPSPKTSRLSPPLPALPLSPQRPFVTFQWSRPVLGQLWRGTCRGGHTSLHHQRDEFTITILYREGRVGWGWHKRTMCPQRRITTHLRQQGKRSAGLLLLLLLPTRCILEFLLLLFLLLSEGYPTQEFF